MRIILVIMETTMMMVMMMIMIITVIWNGSFCKDVILLFMIVLGWNHPRSNQSFSECNIVLIFNLTVEYSRFSRSLGIDTISASRGMSWSLSLILTFFLFCLIEGQFRRCTSNFHTRIVSSMTLQCSVRHYEAAKFGLICLCFTFNVQVSS